jgi:hypothetical protein
MMSLVGSLNSFNSTLIFPEIQGFVQLPLVQIGRTFRHSCEQLLRRSFDVIPYSSSNTLRMNRITAVMNPAFGAYRTSMPRSFLDPLTTQKRQNYSGDGVFLWCLRDYLLQLLCNRDCALTMHIRQLSLGLIEAMKPVVHREKASDSRAQLGHAKFAEAER